jgi:SH3-like domain-containing protein
MSGQDEHRQFTRRRPGLLKSAAFVLGLSAGVHTHAFAAPSPPSPERQTPSGMAVPRYVSTKFDKVNARVGPGDDYRLQFVYRVRGLPLQIVAETSEWRRVCDPSGALAWIHKRTVDGRRRAMNTQTMSVALLKKPRHGWKVAAYLNPRALATLERCEKGWCRVKADGASGWVREGELWGTSEAQQCH